ncbi:hypothetical protein SAMN04488057_1056 [Cyclobacterium lianum]|uniref:Uncharacterized protein n=1 Tax=Cyclobacterium lianum TaxID=388280 RepID=A0A1M7N1S1_9BACT|nr:hypothetical protein [Cyclobacterium lianum]SHM97451.1 hypothetical protein SAMN04488057_1056 [Cyclobacterium lianum]
MTQLKEFIEAYSDLLKSDNEIVHCDNDGNIYTTVEEAYAAKKSGKEIELINRKEKAIEELKDIGITKIEASQMVQILDFLYKSKRGRKPKS